MTDKARNDRRYLIFVLLFSYENIINEREAKTRGEAHEELRPLKFYPPHPSLSPVGRGGRRITF
jgi:hypothetical protein